MSKKRAQQEKFFNAHSNVQAAKLDSDFFEIWNNKEQVTGLQWLGDTSSLLDFGCGVGTTIDRFFDVNPNSNVQIIGCDISGGALSVAQKKYPKHIFYKIADDDLSVLEANSIDAAVMLHVLHHTDNHRRIFENIHEVLSPGGKFLINDLTSANPFIRSGRSIFNHMPHKFKRRFDDDLQVDGKVPEKYPIDISHVENTLRDVGFDIHQITHGHLFLFIFGWLERFIPLADVKVWQRFIQALVKLETELVRFRFWQRRCEVISIAAVKRHQKLL